ncbi:1463_t:CDS:2, partial [Ambispora gerdemannii]
LGYIHIRIYNSDSAPRFDLTTFSTQKKDNHSVVYAFCGKIPNNRKFSDLIDTNDFYKIDVSTLPFSFLRVDSPPQAQCCMSSVIDNKGKLHIWGGRTNTLDRSMYIFDTFGSTWNQILPSGYVPDQRKAYSATFKDDKFIILEASIKLMKLLIFDNNRFAHSAVIAPDNRSIIIFGGITTFNTSIEYTLYDYLISLNLETFEFSELKTLNKHSIDDIPIRHTAIMYNKFMIAYIKLLNLSQKDYVWVDKYIAPNSISPPPPNETAINSNILQTQPNIIVGQHNTTRAPLDHNTALPYNIPEIINQQTTTQVPLGYIYAHNDRTSYNPSLAIY